VPDSAKQAIDPDWENNVIAAYPFALFLLPIRGRAMRPD
jgi:hypothetical protein